MTSAEHTCTESGVQPQRHPHQTFADRLVREPVSCRELQHARVGGEHIADEHSNAALPAVSDDLLHQSRAESVSFEIGAYQHRKLGELVVGIGLCPHDTQCHAMACVVFTNGDERHRTLVVDLREIGQIAGRQFLHRAEEPCVHVGV